jgi:SAM-dependent methyltransferase
MQDTTPPPRRLQWTPELVERFWTGMAGTRLTEMSFSKQAGRSLVLAIEHLLPEDGTILDFGAGDGHLIRLLCERGQRAAAYEPSSGRASNLEARLRDCPGFAGTRGPDTGECFDMVIMAEVIEHILDEDFEPTLSRLARLVRPAGVLVVTTPNNEDLELAMAYCPVSNLLFHRWQHVRSFTAESLATALSLAGFDEIVTHRVEFNDALYVPSDPLWGGAAAGVPLPWHLSEIRANRPATAGSESNLLYIGVRRE